MHEENNNKPGYLSGLVTGLLFGAVAGLLLAPKKGQDLRSELADEAATLKDRAKNLGDSVATAAQDVKAHGAEILSTAKSAGVGLRDEATGQVASVAQDVKEHGTELLNAAAAASSMLKEDAAGHVDHIVAAVSQTAADLKEGAQATVEEAKAVVTKNKKPKTEEPEPVEEV